jgi:hypothetical protein
VVSERKCVDTATEIKPGKLQPKPYKAGSSTHSIDICHGLDDRGIGVWLSAGEKRFLSSLLSPDRLRSPPSHLSNGYREFFSPEVNRSEVTLTTHLHPMTRLRMLRDILPPPIRLHDMGLNSVPEQLHYTKQRSRLFITGYNAILIHLSGLLNIICCSLDRLTQKLHQQN